MFRIAIVLLYTAGLRRGELVRLVISDYDATEQTLLVRRSKFHKSRIVALSRSAAVELERYLRARRRFPHGVDAPLLVTNHGGLNAYSGEGIGGAMHRLFRMADIRTSTGDVPRTHDLRHYPDCRIIPRRAMASTSPPSARVDAGFRGTRDNHRPSRKVRSLSSGR